MSKKQISFIVFLAFLLQNFVYYIGDGAEGRIIYHLATLTVFVIVAFFVLKANYSGTKWF